jgi:hypothetical protein
MAPRAGCTSARQEKQNQVLSALRDQCFVPSECADVDREIKTTDAGDIRDQLQQNTGRTIIAFDKRMADRLGAAAPASRLKVRDPS